MLLEVKNEKTSVCLKYYINITDVCQVKNKHVKKCVAGKLWEKVEVEGDYENKLFISVGYR